MDSFEDLVIRKFGKFVLKLQTEESEHERWNAKGQTDTFTSSASSGGFSTNIGFCPEALSLVHPW
jgi:hypothetical protein